MRKDEEILRESLDYPQSFAFLVAKYEKPFLRLAYGVVRHREEAEDIVQEAFCDIYKNALSYQKREGVSFKSWAYRILLNRAISHYRKAKKERERFVALETQHYENLGAEEELSESLDRRLTIERLLAALPQDLRKVVEMFYLEDKSYSDIAALERVSLPTIKMRLFRAKRMLKELFV